MNKLIAATLIAFASTGVLASEATLFDDGLVGQKSRADVRAELIAGLAAGEPIRAGEASVAPAPAAAMTMLTRKQVRDDVRAALARGEQLNFGEARV